MENFNFTPLAGLQDTSSFPGDGNPRIDIMVLLNQVKDHINGILKTEVERLGTVEAFKYPTFQNSWVNYGGAEAPLRYYKDSLGQVRIEGMITSGTVGTVICTLPEGYRSDKDLLFVVAQDGGVGKIYVKPSGEVLAYQVVNTWLSLTGITFKGV